MNTKEGKVVWDFRVVKYLDDGDPNYPSYQIEEVIYTEEGVPRTRLNPTIGNHTKIGSLKDVVYLIKDAFNKPVLEGGAAINECLKTIQ